jgi:hypothetical protein
MAEGGSQTFSFTDTRQFIYLPTWVKGTILVAATLLFGMAVVAVITAISVHTGGEFVVFFISVGQSAALVLIFFLIASFSRRDANVTHLHVLVDEFLRVYIASALARVSIPEMNLQTFEVKDEGRKDIFGRLLKMTNGDYGFKLWVGLNVRKLFVIYFVPLTESLGLAELKQIYHYTFGGAENSGYACNFEEAQVAGQRVASIWLTAKVDDDLLSNPQEKLFWAQDVAMMTESFLRTAFRNKVDLTLKSISPGPL